MLEQFGKDLAHLKLNIYEIAGLEYPPQIWFEALEQARAQQRLFQSELTRVRPSLTAMQLASETARRIAPALEAFQRQAQEIDQVARLFQTYQAQIRDAFGQIGRLAAVIIPVLHPDPYWQDFEAVEQYGDRNAARRLAQGIPWHPGGWVRKALALRAKAEGKGIDALCLEALTESLLCVVAHMRRLVPVKTEADGLLLTSDGTPSIVRPEDLPVDLAIEWVRQETARGAVLWLFGLPYTPDIILEKHPAEGEDPQLRVFATSEAFELPAGPRPDGLVRAKVAQNRSVLIYPSGRQPGRPRGSGYYAKKEVFQADYIQAYLEVLSRNGSRPAQVEVAAELGIGKRTFQSYLAGFGLPWPPQL
jgi:hypothetical protein